MIRSLAKELAMLVATIDGEEGDLMEVQENLRTANKSTDFSIKKEDLKKTNKKD